MAVAGSGCQGKGMSDAKDGNKDDRAQRLAQALRDNLKRRKAQARAAAKPEDAEPTDG